MEEPAEGEIPQAAVYVKDRQNWLAYKLADDQEIVFAYETPQQTRIFLGFHTAEGPGESLDSLVFAADGTLKACPSLDNPPMLNSDATGKREYKGEFLAFERMTINRVGTGEVVAKSDLEIGGQEKTVHFRFTTSDGGLSWSAVKVISKP